MAQYKDKTELIEAIKQSYLLYDKEFDNIPEDEKNLLKLGVDKSPSQNISYQLGWTRLLLQWESDEKKGIEVQTPSPKYKWNNLGGLHESFYKEYGALDLHQEREILKNQVNEIIEWIETLDHETLFVSEQREWATTPAKWPVWKWMHINTVAPFKNFRAHLRKWKKQTGTE